MSDDPIIFLDVRDALFDHFPIKTTSLMKFISGDHPRKDFVFPSLFNAIAKNDPEVGLEVTRFYIEITHLLLEWVLSNIAWIVFKIRVAAPAIMVIQPDNFGFL
jgi:hypothetical protein